MGSFDIQISIWWLAIPAILVIASALIAIKLKWRFVTALTCLSFFVFPAMAILWPLSWGTNYDIIAGWLVSQPDDRVHTWNLHLVSARGGLRLSLNSFAEKSDPAYPRSQFHIRRAPTGSNYGSYPIWNDKFSITPWPFFQKTLGFQICWWSKVETPPASEYIRMYSITMPHWFVLLLALIFPTLWFRRHRHQRNLRRRGYPLATNNHPVRVPDSKPPSQSAPDPSSQPTTISETQEPDPPTTYAPQLCTDVRLHSQLAFRYGR